MLSLKAEAAARRSLIAEAVPSVLPVDFDKYKFSKILASSVSLRHCALAPTPPTAQPTNAEAAADEASAAELLRLMQRRRRGACRKEKSHAKYTECAFL